MGNNPTRTSNKKDEKYAICKLDEDQAKKHLETANQFFFWEDYDKAIEFYLQSLRYKQDGVEALSNLGTAYNKQNKKGDAFIYFLKKEYAIAGFSNYFKSNQVTFEQKECQEDITIFNVNNDEFQNLASSANNDDAVTALPIERQFYFANKALMQIQPLQKEYYQTIIYQLRKEGLQFELMFFIEQAIEKKIEIDKQQEEELLKLYSDKGLIQKQINFINKLIEKRPGDTRELYKMLKECQSLLPKK